MYIIDSLPHCILSVPKLNLRGLTVTFTSTLLCEIIDTSNTVIISTPIDVDRGLYFFDITALLSPFPVQPTQAIISTSRMVRTSHLTKADIDDVMSLHDHMNHPSVSVMARAIRDQVWTGLPPNITAALVERVFANQPCLPCYEGKAHHWTPGPGTGSPFPHIGYAVSIDFVPVSIPAYGGFTAQFIIRELSVGYVLVFLVTKKTEFLSVIEKTRLFFLKYPAVLRVVYTDAGRVEISTETHQRLALNHITVRPAPPEQQNQNPVERTVQTFNYGIATMLVAQQFLPNAAWGLASISYAATLNATPNVLSGDSSPMFLLTAQQPHIPTLFKFSFGQPGVCPRLKQDPIRTQFRYGTYGELGFAVGCDPAGTGAIRVIFPDRKRNAVYIRLEAKPIQLSNQKLPHGLTSSAVSIDANGRIFDPSENERIVVDNQPIDPADENSPTEILTEIPFDILTSNLVDDTVLHNFEKDANLTEAPQQDNTVFPAPTMSLCWCCAALSTYNMYTEKDAAIISTENIPVGIPMEKYVPPPLGTV